MTPKVDWLALSPTLALLAAAGVALLGAVLGPALVPARRSRRRRRFAGFVTAFVFAASSSSGRPEAQAAASPTSMTRDRWAALAAIVAGGRRRCSPCSSRGASGARDHVGEYYALLAAAAAGWSSSSAPRT